MATEALMFAVVMFLHMCGIIEVEFVFPRWLEAPDLPDASRFYE